MIGTPILLTTAALWKVVGVVLGIENVRRFQANRIYEHQARKRHRRFKWWFGRFNLNSTLTVAVILFNAGALSYQSLRANYQALFDESSKALLLAACQVMVLVLCVAIPIVEVVDRWLANVFPDPEDPVENRLPPFRDNAGVIWLFCILSLPFLFDPNVTAAKLIYSYVVFIFGGAFLSWVGARKRQAHLFPLKQDSVEAELVARLTGETGSKVFASYLEIDHRTFVRVGLLRELTMSTRFAERHNDEEKAAIIRFELARAHPKHILALAALVALTVILSILLMALLAGAGVLVSAAVWLLAAFWAWPTLREMQKQAIMATLGPTDRAVVASYLTVRRPA